MKGMKPDANNTAMVMDLYELTMANGYFLEPQLKETKVAFDVFFRKIPDIIGIASDQIRRIPVGTAAPKLDIIRGKGGVIRLLNGIIVTFFKEPGLPSEGPS